MTRDAALFRCDATPEIGAGHATRCLALAEALQDAGWRITFIVNEEAVSLVPALAAGAFKVRIIDGQRDELEVLRQEANGAAELLVIDHYQRDIRFEKACRDFARQILVMDDATGRRHECDYLVDAATRDRSAYQDRVPASAELLLGSGYALVRRAFVARRAEALRRRNAGRMTDILVSFGATDPSNVTPVVLDALASYAEQITITVALSSHAPHLDEVRAKLHGRMRLILDGDMPLLMSGADIAIGAAGVSSYERAVLGVPAIIVRLTGNQHGVATTLAAAGAALDAEDCDAGLRARLTTLAKRLIEDMPTRRRVSQAAASLVDGRGTQRLLAALTHASSADGAPHVRLRPAEYADRDFLLSLQRTPGIRRHARNPEPPTAEEHADWFDRTLADSDRLLSVIEADGRRAGMIRLDRLESATAGTAFEISIAVCPALHGRGIATTALGLARQLQPGAIFEAEVLSGNLASQALFRKAGFRQVGLTRFRQGPHDCPSPQHDQAAI